MWTLTGPFDGEIAGELNFQKTKLLKTGTSYSLGRKACSLIIASKKISSHHCDFVAGSYSVDDVGEPTKKPTLECVNKKDKGMRISRDGAEIHINPSSTKELQDGDVIAVISGVLITVQWTPVCCYTQPIRGKSATSLEACATLGINLVQLPNPHVTHHLISSYTASASVAASMLSASQLVKPEWLTEVLRLGNLPLNSDPSGGVPLEQTFTLPFISKFRPSFTPSLPTSQKVFRVWEPNEERLSMFSKFRFLWVGEKAGGLDGDFRGLIERGGGSFEIFDIHGGKLKLHKALARGQAKEGKTQLVIGKESSMKAAVGKNGWKELVKETKSFGLHFIEPDVIVQAVINTDTSLFDVQPAADIDDEETSSILPDFIPNTHPDEPSIPPESEQRSMPPKRLTRRVASRQASQEPAASVAKTPEPEEAAAEIPRPRRALTRRVNAGVPVITGLDDPSSIFDSALDSVPPASPPPQSRTVVDLTAPTPMRSTRLKRRVVGGVPSATLESQIFTLDIDESSKEPPLKKFKALFDASHPDRTGAGSFDEAAMEDIQSAIYSGTSQTQTQTMTQGGRAPRSGATANLSTLREEEEESQSGMGSVGDSRGTKRSLADIDEVAEMVGVESGTLGSGSRSGPSLPKRRAMENVNAVEKVVDTSTKPASTRARSKPPSTATAKSAKQGAAPGKPDKDDAFLKAIASTKRGKKMEDEFDRDFNKLKISKPDLGREEPEKQWAVLENFGDETNIRGNFMVVVEMEVFDKQERRTPRTVAGWEGKPNFKKFKKKDAIVRKSKIELVVSEENDYGMGAAYWKGAATRVPSQGNFNTQKQPEASAHAPPRARSQALVIKDSDDEVEFVPRKGRSKPASRIGSTVPTKKASSRTMKSSAKSQPLFLDSDDDTGLQGNGDDSDAPADSNEDEQTLKSSADTTQQTTRAPRRVIKPAPILADDDSDDAVFKGFGGKKRGR